MVSCIVCRRRLVVEGIPEGIAALRRDSALEIRMYGDRITYKRNRRRLMEVRRQHACVTPSTLASLGWDNRRVVSSCVRACVQVVLCTQSPLVGKPLSSTAFRDMYQSTAVGIRCTNVPSSAKNSVDESRCECHSKGGVSSGPPTHLFSLPQTIDLTLP